MAIVNELGMEQLCAVMGSGASTVSLAACHLLQVMFEALTEGMKKEIRGKDEAILPGEFGRRSIFILDLATHESSPGTNASFLSVHPMLALVIECLDLTQNPPRSYVQCYVTSWR